MNLIDLCAGYDLEAPIEFCEASEKEVKEIFNGAGPDYLPDWSRWILSFFLRLFMAAFVVHDWEYEYSDKTRRGFQKSNKRLLKNMLKILNIEYPLRDWWAYPLRIFWRGKAFLAYEACRQGGWSAWLND